MKRKKKRKVIENEAKKETLTKMAELLYIPTIMNYLHITIPNMNNLNPTTTSTLLRRHCPTLSARRTLTRPIATGHGRAKKSRGQRNNILAS